MRDPLGEQRGKVQPKLRMIANCWSSSYSPNILGVFRRRFHTGNKFSSDPGSVVSGPIRPRIEHLKSH